MGNNYRLSDINCALGLSQMKKMKKFIDYRKKIFLSYKKKFQELRDYIKLPNYNIQNDSSYHLFLISLNLKNLKCSKDKLFSFLNKKGLFPQYHYTPIFKFSFYKNKDREKYYGASEYYKNTLSLPIYFGLKKTTKHILLKVYLNLLNCTKKFLRKKISKFIILLC